MIFYLCTLSYWSNVPQDIGLRDSNEHPIFDVASSFLNGERTSVDTEEPHGTRNPPSKEQPKDAPVNKGNIAQAVDKLHQAEEDNKNYPKHGVEIKPVADDGDKSRNAAAGEAKGMNFDLAVKEELASKTGGQLNTRSKKLPLKSKDNRPSAKPESVPHRDTESHNSEPGIPTTDRQPEKENLYVHSSMPLGPALKIRHTERQRAVVDAFKHAWSNYKKYAWGEDDLHPLSRSYSSTDYGMAMTMVDSLDTLWLMGLEEEFNEARDWIADNLRFADNSRKVVVFEVNIRVLGGLLSAYHLSGEKVFLTKAVSFVATPGPVCSSVLLHTCTSCTSSSTQVSWFEWLLGLTGWLT